MVGTIELYLLSIGESVFHGDGRELHAGYGVALILAGCFIANLGWRNFASTAKGWTQVPHRSIAIVAILAGMRAILEIAGSPQDTSNYAVFGLSSAIAASWWCRAKYIEA